MSVLRRNNVVVSGHGQRNIVFAHGYACDMTAWRDIAPSFEPDWRVTLFDHVGAGNSELAGYDRVKYGTLHGYAADILEIMAALDISRAVFVGHSMSAIAGMLAAIEQPDRFDKLVMVCPSPCFVNDGTYVGGFDSRDLDDLLEVIDANFLGWAHAAAPVIMGDRGHLGEVLVNSFCRTDPDIARNWAQVVFRADHRADVAKCAVPSLVLQTSEDFVAPVAVGEWMHGHLPHSEYVLMSATGHCPHMSAPRETIAAIRHFVEGAVADGR